MSIVNDVINVCKRFLMFFYNFLSFCHFINMRFILLTLTANKVKLILSYRREGIPKMLRYSAILRNREKLGISQEKLSKLTGIRPDMISRLENGRQMNPTLLTLEKLAKALEIPVAKLIDETQVTA
jgi:DNA-binding XRE family transcriptional regulator